MSSEATGEKEILVVTIREVKYGEVRFEKASVGRVLWVSTVTWSVWMSRGWDKAREGKGHLIALAYLPLALVFTIFL